MNNSVLGLFATPPPSPVCALPVVRAPLSVNVTLPIEDDGPIVAELLLVGDARDTVGNGPTRDAIMKRLCLTPSLVGKVVKRRLTSSDATIIARVTEVGAETVAGAPLEGTEIVLNQLIERQTAADLATLLRDGLLREKVYYMSATRCVRLTLVVEGALDVSTVADDDTRAEFESYLAELSVTSNFNIKRTADLARTVLFYASLVSARGRRLGSRRGLMAWLACSRSRDENARLLTYPMWDDARRKMGETNTLQQMPALQLHIDPGVAPERINRIMEGGFTVSSALQSSYREEASPEDGKMLLARLVPPQRGAPVSKKLSEFVYLMYKMDLYSPQLCGPEP
ncbi:hypothetical protein I4F81_003511 [Pyropia yezoensis]|uniref:Uncharacterized protein n=1 Tax=Pyropia yezoensis TaxID=2788 RepID=A0ACC3BSE3_PYRYE|nr:hypothetical protein I4F81_003511 [Neopyropia yezoensis]